MNEINLVQNIKDSFELVKDLEKQESSIIFAIDNSELNKFYFNAGKRDYFVNVFNNLKDIKQKYMDNKDIIDPITYENIIKSIDKFMASIEISIKSIDNIVDDYSNYREIDFTNLKNSFYQNKINSDVYLKDMQKINFLRKNNNNNESKNEQISNREEIIEDRVHNEVSYEGIKEEKIYEQTSNEKVKDEVKKEKNAPKPTVEEMMENIEYSSFENYNQKLMYFRTKHEIDLINNQIMVLENSAKIKDLIMLEQLKSKKNSLEQYLEKYNNKKKGIIVSRENLIKKNDSAINLMKQNISDLSSNTYESKLFNSVNNLKIFVTTTYMNKLNKSKQKLIIDQRQAVINKFNGKYANISKLASIKGTVVGTIDKLKIIKNQVIEEANKIKNDIENINVNSAKYSI